MDCETLSKLISPTIPIDTVVLNKINLLESQIENEEIKLETILSDLDILRIEFENLNYSIVCDSFPVQDTSIITPIETTITPSSKQIVPFTKTAFGNISPFSFAAMTTKEITFCLTEPKGLEIWSSILGNRYQRFLAGDSSSYTCDDVITIFNTQSTDVLLYECTTPFGTKTIVKDKIVLLEAEEIETRNNIIILQTELNTVITTETNSCNNPIGVLETMDVSVSIDVMVIMVN